MYKPITCKLAYYLGDGGEAHFPGAQTVLHNIEHVVFTHVLSGGSRKLYMGWQEVLAWVNGTCESLYVNGFNKTNKNTFKLWYLVLNLAFSDSPGIFFPFMLFFSHQLNLANSLHNNK